MKSRIFRLSVLLLLASSFQSKANPPIEEGKSIFLSRCAACHNINKPMTGPALSGVGEKRSIEWLVKFIQSSQTLIKSGDADAVKIF